MKRHILVIGLCLSYLGCLASLWYIWNAPRQGFDMFWMHFAYNRLTLIIIPLIVFCGCYFRLRHIGGDALTLRAKKLDERQRMVRDQAHRSAYKFVALLCLLIAAYFAIQSLSANTQITQTPVSKPVNMIRPSRINLLAQSLIRANALIQPGKLRLLPSRIVIWYQIQVATPKPASPPQPTSALISSHALFNQGIYYGLVLLTLLLIVWTLPETIIAWKER